MDKDHSGDLAAGDQLQIRPIAGYPGYYVNSEGEVWSEWVTQGWGRRRSWRDRRQWRMLSPGVDAHGYLRVILYNENGRKTAKIHRLVLETFIGPCPEGMECRHLNGNQKDNRLANLAWGTRQENADDRVRHRRGKP